MKSLVTGATGFIGSHLVEALAAAGQRVRALIRPTSGASHLERLGVELCVGDLTDPPGLEQVVAGVERIFRCAAFTADWDPECVSYGVNVEGTVAPAGAALRARVRKLVYLSTTEVYGHPDAFASEDTPYRYRGWPYCDTKIDAERRIWEYHRQGLPVTVLRPATVYGPRCVTLIGEIVKLPKRREMVLIGGGNW